MSVIAFVPKRAHKGDGYQTFRPEADAFVTLHGGRVVEIDAQKMAGIVPRNERAEETKRRREQVLSAICVESVAPSHVAFFCHGWRSGMQLGFDTKSVDELASALGSNAIVTLYSCACGAGKLDTKYAPRDSETGDGGFADALRDSLVRFGNVACRVDAHATVGHATSNPYVRRFDGSTSVGGSWIVAPGSSVWGAWRKALKTRMRFRFPFMSVAEIHSALAQQASGASQIDL